MSMQIIGPITIGQFDGINTVATNGTYYDSNGLLQSSTSTSVQDPLWDSRLIVTRAGTATRKNGYSQIEIIGANLPRFDYDASGNGGLLVEESRTNLLTYSESFDNAAWTKTRTSVTPNVTLSPYAVTTNNGGKLVEDSSNNTHIVTQAHTGSNETATFSVFAKPGERTSIHIVFTNNAGNTCGAIFNLSNGTITSTDSANADYTNPLSKIETFSGWYRCTITVTKGSVNTTNNVQIGIYNGADSYLGNGSNGVYLWGAQLEIGAFGTSYIPTTSASVTRNADNIVMSGQAFSNWFSSTNGTFIIDWSNLNTASTSDSTAQLFKVSYAGADPSISLRIGYSSYRRWRAFMELNSGSLEYQVDSGYSLSSTSNGTVYLSYAQSNWFLVDSGVGSGSDVKNTGNVTGFVANQLQLGNNGTNYFNGHIKRFTYYNYTVLDTDIPGLTANGRRGNFALDLNFNPTIQFRSTYDPVNITYPPYYMMEPSRSNYVLNQNIVSSSGSPGSLNWFSSPGNTGSITQTVSSSGIDSNNIYYVPIRYQFSSAATATFVFNNHGLNTFALNDSASVTIAIRLASGSLTNLSLQFEIREYNSGSTLLGTHTQNLPTITNASLVNNVYTFTATCTNASTAGVAFAFNIIASGTADATFQFALLQLEKGAWPTSTILTPASLPVTRTADVFNQDLMSNVTETATWNNYTIYFTGQQVIASDHNIYQSITGTTGVVTMTIASPCVVTWNAHGLAAGTPITFITTSALPTGITAGTVYYVLSPTTNTFNIAATVGGSAINTSGSQSGVHTASASSNYGVSPLYTNSVWTKVSTNNKRSMFDAVISSQTTATGPIQVLINTKLAYNDIDKYVDSVALLNVQSSYARVVAYAAQNDASTPYKLIYNQVIAGTAQSNLSAYEPTTTVQDMLFQNIPKSLNLIIAVSLTSTSTTKCGECVVGLSKSFGSLQADAKIGIQDYSVKTQDAFGNYTILQRAFSKKANFTVWVDSTKTDAVENILAAYRTTPIVYVGDTNYGSTFVYGFYKDFSITLSYPTVSICEIEVESLT